MKPSGDGARPGAVKIAPSLLAADFVEIRDAIEAADRGGADYFHLDVMDGRFVPNITWGPKLVHDMRKLTKTPFDVHLMIVEPERYVEEFIQAGAQLVSVHWEALTHANRIVSRIREKGAKAGIAINPATSLSVLDEILPYVDYLVVMSVNPGFSYQEYIAGSTAKVATARRMIGERRLNVEIEVDGGVSLDNAAEIAHAGADILVMGAGIYGTPAPAETIGRVRAACAP